jgi:hypothetical protein
MCLGREEMTKSKLGLLMRLCNKFEEMTRKTVVLFDSTISVVHEVFLHKPWMVLLIKQRNN